MERGGIPQPAIEVRGVRKIFRGVTAVDGIDFSVPSGEFFGLLGPNGAGKTTTIRMIYGFSPLSEGSLHVFGKDIRTHWREIRSRIGVCQQENTLDPDLTVEQNLRLFAGYFSMDSRKAGQRTSELLEFFALSHKRDAKVEKLSGGMIRRLMLARALINTPDLIILDEPTTGLDPQSRHQVWDKLHELKGRGVTVLLTTHYMEEAAVLCDRLVIMDHGKLLVEGSPEELIERYAGKTVMEIERPDAAFMEAMTRMGADHERLGERVFIYLQENSQAEAFAAQSVCSTGCTLRPSTLEDVFLRLTGRELRE